MAIREVYRHSKIKRAEEEEWKIYGHLPRLSIAQKKISESKIWKTSALIANFHMDRGGYTSRANNFENFPEIQSLEDGKRLGFTVVNSENL